MGIFFAVLESKGRLGHYDHLPSQAVLVYP